MVKPDIAKSTIVGVSCAIIVLLFLIQPLGIHRVSSVFAPVVIIWLLFNAAFGIHNLVSHDWTVLKAFSPFYAGDWFVRNGTAGWINLGGLLLAFTGVEALFADLGVSDSNYDTLKDCILIGPAHRHSRVVPFNSHGFASRFLVSCLHISVS